jgi:hypothetical protein
MAEQSSDERHIAELSEVLADPVEAAAAGELAAAERAVAQHTATDRQAAGVAAVRGIRRPEDRVRAWLAATGPSGS